MSPLNLGQRACFGPMAQKRPAEKRKRRCQEKSISNPHACNLCNTIQIHASRTVHTKDVISTKYPTCLCVGATHVHSSSITMSSYDSVADGDHLLSIFPQTSPKIPKDSHRTKFQTAPHGRNGNACRKKSGPSLVRARGRSGLQWMPQDLTMTARNGDFHKWGYPKMDGL